MIYETVDLVIKSAEKARSKEENGGIKREPKKMHNGVRSRKEDPHGLSSILVARPVDQETGK